MLRKIVKDKEQKSRSRVFITHHIHVYFIIKYKGVSARWVQKVVDKDAGLPQSQKKQKVHPAEEYGHFNDIKKERNKLNICPSAWTLTSRIWACFAWLIWARVRLWRVFKSSHWIWPRRRQTRWFARWSYHEVPWKKDQRFPKTWGGDGLFEKQHDHCPACKKACLKVSHCLLDHQKFQWWIWK